MSYSYELEFHEQALKEWNSLDGTIKQQFKKKIKERLKEPRVEKDKLSGHKDTYKIKLKKIGYRLAYEVIDDKLIVFVVAIGKRENNEVYNSLDNR